MDAEIRRLTYVQRFAGAAPGGVVAASVLTSAPGQIKTPKIGGPHHAAVAGDIRLEARVIELERESAESERRAREALHAAHVEAEARLEAALHAQQETLESEWAARIAQAVASFERRQSQYFLDVEKQVVRLVLAVAARVLHREAQIDPLLLRGPVRVALEDLQQNASCLLEVSAERAKAWERWLSKHDPALMNVQLKVAEGVPTDHCRLEIDASSADLSPGAQLAEIERGFFDLLDRRPIVSDEVSA